MKSTTSKYDNIKNSEKVHLSESIQIVPVEYKHYDEVVKLLQIISQFEPDKNNSAVIFEKYLHQSNNLGIVALMKERVVGFATVFIEKKIRGGMSAHIEDVVCHEEFRRLGVGTSLMRNIELYALKMGCYKITLQCKEENIAFYESCGLKVSGVTMQLIL